jgi:hypothetical protein
VIDNLIKIVKISLYSAAFLVVFSLSLVAVLELLLP